MIIAQVYDTHNKAEEAFRNFCKYNGTYFNLKPIFLIASNPSVTFKFISCSEKDVSSLQCVQAEVLQYFGKNEIVANMVMSRVGRFRNDKFKLPKSMENMVQDYIKLTEVDNEASD